MRSTKLPVYLLFALSCCLHCQGYRDIFSVPASTAIQLKDCNSGIRIKTQTEWVSAIGQVKTDQLIASVGLSGLNAMGHSACFSEVFKFFDTLSDVNKFLNLLSEAGSTEKVTGLLVAFGDSRNNSNTNLFAAFLNNMPLNESFRFYEFLSGLRTPLTIDSRLIPSADYTLFSQLMADYSENDIGTRSGIGVQNMNILFGNFNFTNGQSYSTQPTIIGGALNGGGGIGATATAVTTVGAVTKIILTNEGTNCTAINSISLLGGAGTGAIVGMTTAPQAGNDTFIKLKSVYVINGGTGYTSAPAVSFISSCTIAPAATTMISGLSRWIISNPGNAYTDSFSLSAANVTGGGGFGASGTVLVAGSLDTSLGLTAFVGGSGYLTGQLCPINGAGGSDGVCTVIASSGAISGCSMISGGNNYIDGKVVSIGGAATARAIVSSSGETTGFVMENVGCGYNTAPNVTLLTGLRECESAGQFEATLTQGSVTSINIITPAIGCPPNPTVIIGETPYAAHGDGGTAIVNRISMGTVLGISMSSANENFADLISNQEKSPPGKAMNYGSASPNISAREGLTRLFIFGADSVGAGYVPFFGVNRVSYPGIGSPHMAKNVLLDLSGAGTTQNLIAGLNSDTTDLSDYVVLIGCADHDEFAKPASLATMTVNDFHHFCSNHSPTLW